MAKTQTAEKSIAGLAQGDPDVLETLSTQTGLSRQELLARLSRELPNAVDKYTPQGHLPTPA